MEKKIKAIEYIDKANNAAEGATKCKSIEEIMPYLQMIQLSCSLAKDHLLEMQKKINELC